MRNRANTIKLTEEQVSYLVANYSSTSYEKMEEVLGIKTWAIKSKARGLGLTKHWTKEETEFLKNNYHTMTVAQLMEELGRSKDSIAKKAERMKLRKYNNYKW